MDWLKKSLIFFSVASILVLVCGCVDTPDNNIQITVNPDNQNSKGVDNVKTQNPQSEKELQNNINQNNEVEKPVTQENQLSQNTQNYEESNNDFDSNYDESTSETGYYIEISYPGGIIPDKLELEEQTMYYIEVIDPVAGGLAGVDIYVDDEYIGTLDDVEGVVECVFYEPGYHTITAEYNGEILASETVYVEESTTYSSGEPESYNEYDNNYESNDIQQTQTQQSEIEINVESIRPNNSIIIEKLVLTPGVLISLNSISPSLGVDVVMENGEPINLKYISMEVDLAIDNPNSESVTIDKLILNMFDDERHSLGRGEIQDIQITPGMNSATVKVDIRIDKMGYEILKKLSGYEAIAEISGSAYMGDEEIPFSGEGELLPSLPEPSVPLPPLPPFPAD